MTEPVAELLPRLEGVRQSGGGWTGRCPAHDDRTASLSIGTGDDGRALLHCHAGCTPEAVAGAVGFALADLFPPQEPAARLPSRPNRIVAMYAYRDETGAVLSEAVRLTPKDFRQRRPDGAGGWIWSVKGVRKVPYRLPELVAALAEQPGRVVFVTEGEKDADRLRSLGLVATCNAGGSKKWAPELSEPLRGARVVILPDNDVPGREHAADVARKLHGIAAEIRVVELPDLGPRLPKHGRDVSDWLDAGGTAAKLKELVRAAPLWTPEDDVLPEPSAGPAAARVVCMADVEPEEVRWLWHPYIPRRKLTLLEGDPGDGKTFLALTLAAALSRGDPLPGDGTRRKPLNVLYWTAEDGLADTLRPRLDAAGADPELVYALDPETPAGDFLTLDTFVEIEGALDRVRPALLVIDPLQGALGPKVDAHRANETRPRMTRLRLWAERYDLAVVVIRHLSKASSSKAIHRGLGSIDFAAAARSVLLVGRDPGDPGRRALVQTKSSLAEHGPALEYSIEGGRVRWSNRPSTLTAAALLAPERSEEDSSAMEQAEDFLRELLADGKAVKAEDVKKRAGRAGVSERTLYRAKRSLNVVSEKQTGEHGAWIWRLPTPPRSGGGNLGNLGNDKAPVGENIDCQPCQPAGLGGGGKVDPFLDLAGAATATAPEDAVMTRREWADALCRRLSDTVAAETPAGLGHWDGAWELVEAPSGELLDTLADFEATGSEEDKQSAVRLAGDVLGAWREAARRWEQAGRAAAEARELAGHA